MTLAPETMNPVETWTEFLAKKECFCSICRGSSEGLCGYRPHTLKSDCWCLGKSAHRDCRITRDWQLTDKDIEEAGSSSESKEKCGPFS